MDKKAFAFLRSLERVIIEAKQSEHQITICCSQDNNERFFFRNDPRVLELRTSFNLSNDTLKNVYTMLSGKIVVAIRMHAIFQLIWPI